MARPGLTKHRKFLRLSRAIGNAPLALGCLEFIWAQCYEAGEDYLGDAVDVEAAAQWPGTPGALCTALLAAGGEGVAGFIEEVQGRPGHYRCHDLYDHAPEYVRKRMDREAQRRAQGVTLREIRAAAGRASGESRRLHGTGDHAGTNAEQMSNTCSTNGTTPAPAPTPAPTPLVEDAFASSCSEPAKAASVPDPSPVVLTLPCKGMKAQPWPITEAMLRAWAEAYPGTDPLAEARKMRLWLESNPMKGKTHQGMSRFALSWLGRAQDSAKPTPQGGTHGTRSPQHRQQADAAYLQQLRERQAAPPAGDPAAAPEADADLQRLWESAQP